MTPDPEISIPKFVVLYHETSPTSEKANHWDFMLEADGILQTWRLELLCFSTEAEEDEYYLVPCERIEDHRLDYLKIQGPISHGRGSVRRIAEGEYEPQSEGVILLRTSSRRWDVRLEEQTNQAGENQLCLRIPAEFWEMLKLRTETEN